MSALSPFRLDDPLPEGRAVLEASAGTGKTYAIAGVVTRLLAGDEPRHPVAPEALLVVTFTRAAAAELRERVRHRVADAVAHLAGERLLPEADLLRGPLEQGGRQAAELRLANLQRALVDLDSATIGTIHAFCAQLLRLGGIDDSRVRDDAADDTPALLQRLTRDRLVRLGLMSGGAPLVATVKETQVQHAAAAVVGAPACRTVPDPAALPLGDSARLHAELVLEIVQDLAAHRARTATSSFDDQLLKALALVRDHGSGGLAGPIRQRYQAVLIDEFQDTDPVQWEVFDTLFPAGGPTRLVVVGDPKQSIYAFRGADVEAYRAALGSAASRRTLSVNHRADDGLVTATNRLFEGATFGPAIEYQPVSAAPGHEAARLSLAGPALEIRYLPPHPGLVSEKSPIVTLAEAEDRVDLDVADVCVELLTSRSTLLDEGGWRALEARDIAVIVATNAQAKTVHARLAAAGVPSTLTGAGSVFTTVAARQLRWLLEAVERPSSEARVRGALLGWFGGTTAQQVAELDDAGVGEAQERVAGWADLLERRGVTALLRQVAQDEGYVERLLARPDGERHLTDVDHLAELLHAAWLSGARRAAELLGVLASGQVGGDERAADAFLRRVDTDDEAVVITTVHASKGLEYPVVLVPYLWRQPSAREPWIFHTPTGTTRGPRTVDLAAGFDWTWDVEAGATKAKRKALAEAEEAEECFRDLYVALTRARHRLVVWWPYAGKGGKGGPGTARSPLGRLLWSADERGRVHQANAPAVPDPFDVPDAILRRLGPDAASVVVLPEVPARFVLTRDRPETADLHLARIARPVHSSRRRWSFTALAASSHPHDRLPPVEPDPVGADDEAGPGEAAAAPRLAPADLPFESTPGGTAFGTLVHTVLEQADFAAADLPAELATVTAEVAWAGRWAPHRPAIAAGLAQALRTPLGPVGGGRPLAGTPRGHRLDELSFDLSLPDGAEVSGRALGAVLLAHLPADDLLRPYAEDLAVRPGPVIAGYLTGSIDLLLRIPEHDAFVVVDYKTNHLHREAPEDPAGAYGPAGLAAAMAHADYPLQALLYAVAAHRYLRWRCPARPVEDLVPSVAYLFLRGMSGPDAAGQGVFTWVLPAAAVMAASDVLAGLG